jgi:hypothetical protein
VPTTAITPKTLINQALKKANVLGVGQTAGAEDINDAFLELNLMLAEWQTDRFLVYQTVDVSCAATGAQSYTIGPGMNFDVARPDRIEQAFARQNPTGSPTPVDYPLETLFSREDYDRIRLKSLGSWPQAIYYDRGFPTGSVFVWPIPNSTFELHLTLMQQLQQFTNPAQAVNLPPLYNRAILYNLTVVLYPMYGLQPNPVVVQLAKKALNRLRGTNAEIPRLVCGDAQGSTNIYDPYNAGSN